MNLLRPRIVNELQSLLANDPDWRIEARVDPLEKVWPGMGLIIDDDEIIDRLQREFLPPEFRFTCGGSKRV